MAAELKIGIGADNSGLKQGLQDAEAQISAFVSKVGKIGQIGEQLSSIGQKMSVGLTLPILALGGSAIKAYAEFQKLEMGLAATMKSAELAKQEMQALEDVAKLPGLGMKEAVKGSIRLQAIGISADNARNIMQQFGNATAAAGGGLPEFERAIYGVQQLANTDFPLGEDLNIIKDALPQVAGLLNDAFGTANTEKIREAGVTSKEVLDVILKGLGELPRVKTGIAGAFENLSDTIAKNLNKVGEVIDKTFNISGIIEKVSDGLSSLVGWFEGLSPAIQKTILVVTGLVAAAGPLLAVVGGLMAILPQVIQGFGILQLAITKAGGAMGLLLNPITLVTAGLIGIVTAVVANWSKITPYLVRTANNFIQLYNESQTFRGGVLSIGFAFESLYAVIKSFAISAYNTLKSFGKGVLNLFEGISEMARGFAKGLDGDWSMFQSGWTKANTNVALSFDNLGARIGDVESKYNKLLKNDKLKFVTEADISGDKIAEKTEKEVTNGFQKGLAKAKDKVGVALLDFGQSFKQNTEGFSITNPLDSLFTEEQIKSFEDRMAEYTPRLITPLTNAQIAMEERGIRFQEAVEGLIGEGVVEGLSQAFEAMGGAIAQGGNILQAAGGAILSVLGQFMQMLGKEMIKLAIGTEALAALVAGIKKFIIKNPGIAIALAGVAIVAGKLLSSAGSNIGGGSSGGGGGSVPSGGGTSSQSYSSSFSSGGAGGGEVVFRISGNDLVGVLSRQQDKNTRIGG